jgi:hypothetical protein
VGGVGDDIGREARALKQLGAHIQVANQVRVVGRMLYALKINQHITDARAESKSVINPTITANAEYSFH